MTSKGSSTEPYGVGVCAHARMCVTFSVRMGLMHINVKILSAVRSWPLCFIYIILHHILTLPILKYII